MLKPSNLKFTPQEPEEEEDDDMDIETPQEPEEEDDDMDIETHGFKGWGGRIFQGLPTGEGVLLAMP